MERSRYNDRRGKVQNVHHATLNKKGKKNTHPYLLYMHKEILKKYIKELITIQLPKDGGRDKGRQETSGRGVKWRFVSLLIF